MSVSEYNRISTIDSSFYRAVPYQQRVTPTEDDISRGWYYRYFLAKSNGVDMAREVTKKVYDSFEKNPFWVGVAVKWDITTSPEGDRGAIERNKQQIRLALRIITGIDELLPNLIEYHVAGGYVQTGDLEPLDSPISEISLFD